MSAAIPSAPFGDRQAEGSDPLAARVARAVHGACADALRPLREPAMNPRMLLGLIVYCYAEGTLGSEEIEQRVWKMPVLRNRFGDELPTARDIRRFRRLNGDLIRATLEEVLAFESSERRSPGRDASPSRRCESQGRARAASLLEEALFRDCVAHDW